MRCRPCARGLCGAESPLGPSRVASLPDAGACRPPRRRGRRVGPPGASRARPHGAPRGSTAEPGSVPGLGGVRARRRRCWSAADPGPAEPAAGLGGERGEDPRLAPADRCRGALRGRGAAPCRGDPGLGGRAALPRDGAEPVARPRPGPARRVRGGGVGRVRSGAAAAALGGAAGRRPAVPGPQPGPAAPAGAGVRGAGTRGLRAPDGGAGRGRSARQPAIGAAARERRGGRPGRVAQRRRTAALLLLVPHLHRGAVGARGGRLAPAAARPAGARRGGACGTGGGGAAVAARQDDPGGSGSRPGRARSTAWAGARGLPARGGRGGGRVRGLLRIGLRSRVAARPVWRRARGRAGALLALARGPLSRPLLRPAADRTRLPAGARRAARGAAPPRGLAARARGLGGAGATRVLAHVVGRPVPAGPVPGADAAVPGRRTRVAARAEPYGPRALVDGTVAGRGRALRGGRRRAVRPAAAQPG